MRKTLDRGSGAIIESEHVFASEDLPGLTKWFQRMVPAMENARRFHASEPLHLRSSYL